MSSPSWEAVITQTPAVIVVIAEPDTVHTAGVLEVNNTTSPGAADADRVTGSPTFVSSG